jgi:PAS domain S-box-containing protein
MRQHLTASKAPRPRLPAGAAALIAATTLAAALSAAAVALMSTMPTTAEWTDFALLLPLAAVAPFFAVNIARNHSFHTAVAFIVAGILVLPPALVVTLVVLLRLPSWVKDPTPWYILVFNLANYVLSALAAWVAVDAIGTGSDLSFALAGVAAATVFVVVNHLLLATMLRLARGHSVRQTGLFSRTGLGIELVLALLGVAVGAFAATNPWLLPALLAPLALSHRSLSTVALLRESEERFRTMFEAAPTAVMLCALDGTILASNRSAEALLGYDESELLGMSPDVLRHQDDREDADTMFAELVRGERDSFRREARYATKDGATVVTHLASALIRDADGKPNFVIGMAEDVTEQMELEERLRQSQKLEAIGRLAGGVAHDFNNMLTAIGGYTALALEHAAAGTALRGDLDEIRKAADRAALLTRQLLAFSRKQVLKPELLNLNAIVVELESMLRPLIGEEVVLKTELDPSLGPIEADPSQLQQVVMNLVVNARDAMPGGGTVWLKTANAEAQDGAIEPGRYVTLTVRDEGQGIDETTLRQIFEPFFTTKDAGKGTGLGLATVYGIVKQSGGYVEVESELGSGSSFRIYLPWAESFRVPANEPAPPPPAQPAGGGAKTVLVVEDEDVVRGLIREVLHGEGYTVLIAHDGAEAMAVAEEQAFDLLLTDLSMPGLGGREVAERLRESRPDLKVIYMSGHAEDGVAQGEQPPGSAFIGKPFSIAELSAAVSEILA